MRHFNACQAQDPCPLCESRNAILLAGKCRSGEPLKTVMCLGCGLGRRDPMLTDEHLFDYYSREYRVEIGKGRKPTRRRLWRISECAAARCADLLAYGAHGATVDFGCGASELVFLLEQAGCNSRGFDPDSSHIAWAQATLGVNVEHQSYRSVQIQPGSVNLVTLYHVLEHIPNPADALRCCHEWLAPDGMLVVEVPNLTSVQQTPGNQFIKAHLYYFHCQALVELARRCGFGCLSAGTYDRDENIRCYFRKDASATASQADGAPSMEQAAAGVRMILESHTLLGHLATFTPYRRAGHKLFRNLVEAARTIGKDERAVLDLHAARIKKAE